MSRSSLFLRVSRTTLTRGRIGACLLVVAALGSAAVVPATSASAAQLGVTNGSLEKVTKGVPDCFTRTGAGKARVAWGLTRAARTGKVASTVSITKFSKGAFGLVPKLSTACAPPFCRGRPTGSASPTAARRVGTCCASTGTRGPAGRPGATSRPSGARRRG